MVAGVDGCRAGWVVATLPAGAGRRSQPQTLARAESNAEVDVEVDHVEVDDVEADPEVEVKVEIEIEVRVDAETDVQVEVVAGLDAVLERLTSGSLAVAGIDIPIGLPERGPRACDAEARSLLGPRRSSVFPAPVRAVLGAATYADACAVSRAARGRAVSRQLFNILPKIREADAALARAPGVRGRLFEMCPELSFAMLAGAPLRFPKRTAAGRAERVDALHRVFPTVDLTGIPTPRGAKPDDVLDALAGAWTARRVLAHAHLTLGGETDPTGLTMAVLA
ncbi:MAG TPA: DUF429 domain-containing protein [Acidimicrobiales bacterium]|nr:DUF429 domain-containing protein [Acidimicrobiales bacterium]